MCILLHPVKSVSKTQILAIPSLDRTRQLTVYANQVHSGQPNLMILPVPYPDSVRFERGVMGYEQLFNDLEDSFHVFRAEEPAAWSRSAALTTTIRNAPLPVQTIGPYKASVAESIADIDRLDPTLFQVPAQLKEMLEHTYGNHEMPVPYGFVCCVLKTGVHAYAPIAYSHRALATGIFVPTKHYHEAGPTPFQADWDHVVFTAGTDKAEAHTHRVDDAVYEPIPTTSVQWGAYFPDEFQLAPQQLLRRWTKDGLYINKDLHFRWTGIEKMEKADVLEARSSSPTSRGLTSILSGLRGLWS